MNPYIASQLAKLNPAEHHYSLQIRSDAGGNTNWLNATPQQLDLIGKILEQKEVVMVGKFALQVVSPSIPAPGPYTDHPTPVPDAVVAINEQGEQVYRVFAPSALEIQRTLVISTTHLPVKRREWLDKQVQHRLDQVPARPGDQQLIVDPIGEYGYRVCLDKEATEDYLTEHPANDPLARLLCFGIEQGCDWLAIDRDGPVVDGLLTYEDEDCPLSTRLFTLLENYSRWRIDQQELEATLMIQDGVCRVFQVLSADPPRDYYDFKDQPVELVSGSCTAVTVDGLMVRIDASQEA